MAHINVVNLLQLLFAGLLAGFEVAIHYGVGTFPPSLPDDAQIVFRQVLVRRLRTLAPALFLPSLVLAAVATVRDRNQPEARLQYLAVALLLVWAVIRIARTVPVNSATLEWNPQGPPLNWRELVERTERFHVIAAWAAVLAFVCLLGSVLYGR